MLNRRPPQSNAKPMLMLDARRLTRVLGFFALLAALIQLVLGASPAVVIIALIAAAAGLYGFVALGAYNLGAWLAFFYVLGNVLIALYAKTLFGQPLDSNLYAPLNSFIAIAITSISLLAALLLVRRVGVGRPLFQGVSDPRLLSFLSWACFGFGSLFWLLNRWFLDIEEGSGFGGISLFRDLLLMAVIARTAMLLEQSDSRRSFDGRLALILGVSVILGLIDNSKTATALPVVSHFATTLFYRRGLRLRTVIIFTIGAILFSGIVAPVIHALRAAGQQEMTINQRIDLITATGSDLLKKAQTFDQIGRSADERFSGGYYEYFGGNGAGQMLVGRYASVQQIDPVIDAVDSHGTRGGEALWPALFRLVPSFIYPDKPEYGESYHTLIYYGFVDPEGGKFPTLPLAGQAYASYGYFGLLTIPFFTFLGFLLVVKKLGWQIHRNVYAIFFFCDFVIVYANQGDFGQYMGTTLRNFPLFALVFWLIAQAARVRISRRISHTHFIQTGHQPTTSPFDPKQDRT